jgi:hypothetical protein
MKRSIFQIGKAGKLTLSNYMTLRYDQKGSWQFTSVCHSTLISAIPSHLPANCLGKLASHSIESQKDRLILPGCQDLLSSAFFLENDE